jgi:AraC family transcriptional regulator
LQRRDLPAGPYWVDDRPMQRLPINSGQLLLLDLNEEHSSLQYGSVDCISIYSSRDALNRFQEEHGLPPIGQLRSPRGIAFEDDVIRNLGECLVPAFEWPETANQLFVDHVALALLAHLSAFYGEQPAVLRPFRGGLSPWQERRAKDILLTHIDGKVGLAELARQCGLSRSHFARAFRTATGLPPHKWLLAHRTCAGIAPEPEAVPQGDRNPLRLHRPEPLHPRVLEAHARIARRLATPSLVVRAHEGRTPVEGLLPAESGQAPIPFGRASEALD